jgi:deoxyribonuclease-4
MTVVRIGLHTSTAGSLSNAAWQAAEHGANTLQIFTSSPRTWAAPFPASTQIAELKRLRGLYDLHPLVIHCNYLINLASSDPLIRQKSIGAFRGELERALAIGAEYLVVHPGSHKDHSLEAGIYSTADGLRLAARGLDLGGLTVLLENTAGQGHSIGRRFDELAEIHAHSAGSGIELGFCLDTCHALAAGYDVATRDGLERTLAEAERLLGLAKIPVIHANDSKGALGSRLDRHANIGQGHIGEAGFGHLMRAPALADKAFILETPAEDGGQRRDLDTLKRLSQP